MKNRCNFQLFAKIWPESLYKYRFDSDTSLLFCQFYIIYHANSHTTSDLLLFEYCPLLTLVPVLITATFLLFLDAIVEYCSFSLAALAAASAFSFNRNSAAVLSFILLLKSIFCTFLLPSYRLMNYSYFLPVDWINPVAIDEIYFSFSLASCAFRESPRITAIWPLSM